MFFSEAAVKDLAERFESLENHHDEARDVYFARAFTHGRAKEFAIQGYVRRLNILKQCVNAVFDLLPPTNEDIPDVKTRTEAVICIQAFFINVFGAIDNLALTWVPVSQE